MKRKHARLLLICLCLMLLLTGCRTRSSGTERPSSPPADGSASGQTGEKKEDGLPGEETLPGEMRSDAESREGETGERGAQTVENPAAPRKEYDENAPAEIVPGTDRLLHREGEGDGSPLTGEEARERVSRVNDRAEETATQTVAAQEAEEMGVDPEAEAADSILTYFTVLLSDRMGSLFECQRANVYWETVRDHTTVFKSSTEHSLILSAGAYDVSARLLEENLTVNDGWVVRKNPGVIVKIVDGSVLGSGAPTANAAKGVYQSLVSREGWGGIDAVRSRHVVLLSEELLQTPYLRTAAMLILAKTANPERLSDVDLDEALHLLMEEATGTVSPGTYYFQGGSP